MECGVKLYGHMYLIRGFGEILLYLLLYFIWDTIVFRQTHELISSVLWIVTDVSSRELVRLWKSVFFHNFKTTFLWKSASTYYMYLLKRVTILFVMEAKRIIWKWCWGCFSVKFHKSDHRSLIAKHVKFQNHQALASVQKSPSF